MGSLHPATRYGLEGELGGLGHSRRADVVLLDEEFQVVNTWFGGQLVVEGGQITPSLETALTRRYLYPKQAYHTVRLPEQRRLLPERPQSACRVNAIQVISGILTGHTQLDYDGQQPFEAFMRQHGLCYVTVLERHGHNGNVAHGLLQDFGLSHGAVASTVGHDAHNLIVAGDNEADMQQAVDTLEQRQGGVCVVADGDLLACVALPIAGLMSDERVGDVAHHMEALKRAWTQLGCRLPYMGFNLIPLSVIPALRITDKGTVKVPELEPVAVFES